MNEGALGTGVLGHVRLAESLRALPGAEIELVGAVLAPMPFAARTAARSVPGLRRFDADLQTVRWHAIQGVRVRRAMRDAVSRVRPDVVCVNTHSSALFAGRLPAEPPVVLFADASVWAWHAMSVWRPVRPWSRTLLAPSLRRERRALEQAAVTIAITPWAAETLRAAAPASRVEVLHPGLDIERFSPGPRRPRGAGGPRRVLFVGGRFAAKGGGALLEALAARLGSDVRLDVVSPDSVPARKGVHVHRIAAGAPELVELYRRADVLCLPTYGDASPWVVLEAMACGTAVLATDVGGIADLLGDGGRLVARGDDAALRRVLGELLADDDQRAALGAAGRARCEREYDARRQARRLAERLRAVAGAA